MTVLGPYTSPGTYEYQVYDQLHDPNATRWNTNQIDAYINEARRQVVMDTGCLRSLQQTYCTAGQEQYTFGQVTGGAVLSGGTNYTAPTLSFSGGGGSGVAASVTLTNGAVNAITFTSFGSGYSSVPSYTLTDPTGTGASLAFGIVNVNTYDVLDVHLIWGTERYSTRWLPFRQFSAWYRPFLNTAFQRQSVCWAVYGQTSYFLGPTPDQTYAIEVDSIILPTPLADNVTIDPIPPMSQDPIKFYASYLAKNNAQAYGEAENFLQQYRRRLLEVTSVYTGRIVDPYE